jgi:hypothetical protein
MKIIIKDTTMKERALLAYAGYEYAVLETNVENAVYPIRDVEIITETKIEDILPILEHKRNIEYDMKGGVIAYRDDIAKKEMSF